jgi:hypothetical protein
LHGGRRAVAAMVSHEAAMVAGPRPFVIVV